MLNLSLFKTLNTSHAPKREPLPGETKDESVQFDRFGRVAIAIWQATALGTAKRVTLDGIKATSKTVETVGLSGELLEICREISRTFDAQEQTETPLVKAVEAAEGEVRNWLSDAHVIKAVTTMGFKPETTKDGTFKCPSTGQYFRNLTVVAKLIDAGKLDRAAFFTETEGKLRKLAKGARDALAESEQEELGLSTAKGGRPKGGHAALERVFATLSTQFGELDETDRQTALSLLDDVTTELAELIAARMKAAEAKTDTVQAPTLSDDDRAEALAMVEAGEMTAEEYAELIGDASVTAELAELEQTIARQNAA